MKLNGKPITEDILDNAARKTLLPSQEVGFWFEHLNTVIENRQRGATKAAERGVASKVHLTAVIATSVEDMRLSMSQTCLT